MSPVGDSFRSRCRMFPSLVNCCTIDWFVQVRIHLLSFNTPSSFQTESYFCSSNQNHLEVNSLNNFTTKPLHLRNLVQFRDHSQPHLTRRMCWNSDSLCIFKLSNCYYFWRTRFLSMKSFCLKITMGADSALFTKINVILWVGKLTFYGKQSFKSVTDTSRK